MPEDNNLGLFEKIDKRCKDIFVVLSYPSEITKDTCIVVAGKTFILSDHVSFAVINNGGHQTKGFTYFSEGVEKFALIESARISELHNTALNLLLFPANYIPVTKIFHGSCIRLPAPSKHYPFQRLTLL
jgi:hypothetical protein